MIDKFANGVGQVAEAFFPKPVVYRFLDFKPDEFLELPGGEKYERGTCRSQPHDRLSRRVSVIPKKMTYSGLSLRAIRKAREQMGLTNIWVMVPFVRTARCLPKDSQNHAGRRVGPQGGQQFSTLDNG